MSETAKSIATAKAALVTGVLRNYMSVSQRNVLMDNLRGEERGYFVKMINDLTKLIQDMPVTYKQDGLGDKAMVHLHYFYGSGNWFITEKDMQEVGFDEDDYDQSFGFCCPFGKDDGELGYVSIKELIQNGVELDLHWTIKTLGEAKAQ